MALDGPPDPRPSTTATLSCDHPHIADRDTIACAGDRARIFGINAPELDHPDLGIADEPGGRAAADRTVALTRTAVDCAPAGDGQDRYGGMVARCWSAATPELDAEKLLDGLACQWRR